MTRRPKRKPKPSDASQSEFDFLAQFEANEEAKRTIKGMLLATTGAVIDRVDAVVPPGTFLDKVVSVFTNYTDFPREIPLFAALHLLSAWLLNRGVVIKFAGMTINPDLWTVILAESGAGKTFSMDRLAEVIRVPQMPEPASAAKFITDLETNNRSLWNADEFAQTLKKIETQTHFVEMREYLLKLYDGKELARRTNLKEVVIEKPALTIFASNVKDSFIQSVPPESIVDGFAQRFAYVFAERKAGQVVIPIYRVAEHMAPIRQAWDELTERVANLESLWVSPTGEAAFEEAFHRLLVAGFPQSFFRRIMFRGVKYAALYRVLLGADGGEIGAEEMGWAARICAIHLLDAGWLLREHNMPKLAKLLLRVQEVRDRIWREKGRHATNREIVQLVHGIDTVGQVMALVGVLDA